MSKRLPLVAVLAAIGLLAGCPDNPTDPCPQECERGFQCDPVTTTCLPSPLPIYERELPGRGARITASSDRVWVASLDPSDGGLVVTEIDANRNRNARVIASPTINPQRRLSIDASGRFIAVAWLGATGRYELAYRDLPSDHAIWSFATVAEPTGESYSGTNDFDLEVVNDRGLALAFRDRNRTLRVLRTTEPADGDWSLELVDDGSATDDDVACPEDLREISPALGVGFYPDIAARNSSLAIAYHDADCGDLRLARRGDETWSVTAVDTGELDTAIEGKRAYVGQWPSIANDPAGGIRISYHDRSRGRLLIAAEDDGDFDIGVIDPGFVLDEFSRDRKKIVGAFSQLTIDELGTATVTYFDATLGDLRIARRDAGANEWSREALVTNDAVGLFADHAWVPDVGTFIIAEEVIPTPDGLASRLVLVEEEP